MSTLRVTVALVVALFAAGPAAAQVATMVSRNTAGTAADSHSYRPSISADGRYVAFDSWAGNLAAGVDVGNSGVFVRDVIGGVTELVSTSDDGAIPNDKSYRADISADGNVVVFWSQASNLVAGDTNADEDLFLYDRVAGTVERVNLSSTGEQAAAADGGFHIVGEGPSVSADGRFVAFDSKASNLVADDTNSTSDVFVRDRLTGTTERVSLTSAGAEAGSGSAAPSISDDGRWVAFRSAASLTPDDTGGFDVYLRDRVEGTVQRVGRTFGAGPDISGDGRFVVFESNATDLVPGDTNGKHDVFVFDRDSSTTERVSVSSGEEQGDDDSLEPVVSGDGRWVAFRSRSTNLVSGDGNGLDDIFLRDREAGTTALLSRTAADENDGTGREPAISGDGFFVAFECSSTVFETDDNKGAMDLFLAVREDACPEDPAKLFAGGCGCGTPDLDPDRDGLPSCNDGCPDDGGKSVPGVCGCGLPEGDADADGASDCHDPGDATAMAAFVRETTALARGLSPRAADRDQIVAQLVVRSAYLTAALNNAGFSARQKRFMTGAATALGALEGTSGRALTRGKRKALRSLGKLLRSV